MNEKLLLEFTVASDTCTRKRLFSAKYFWSVLIGIGFLLSSFHSIAGVETIPTGSKIINMGITPQTVANGLKPYGLIYALLKANIPVKWVINQNKIKDGIDFTHNGVNYRGSAFIVPAEYLAPNIVTLINTWTAKGVVVNTTVSSFSLDVMYTIKTAPFWVMDAQNGKIAVQFLDAAEIPSTAYIFKEPSQLTGCDDIYVMPHADPTWETHKNLYYWNLIYKGAFWGGCHAVSVLENTYGPDINNPAITRRLNFLMNDGTAGVDKNAVNFQNHNDGTPPYNTNLPANPVMQFMGSTDAAQQGGSEQVFMPYKPGGSWRPTTNIGVYDPSQADVPLKSDGAVASVVFGRAYGDPNRGQVVYEGGHNISGSSPANVAAQRVFFNSSFQFVLDKQLTTSMTNVPTKMNGNVTYTGFTITASSPIPNNTLTYEWTSTVGGTFSNPTGTVTSYTPPIVASLTTAVISCIVRDACGRVSAESQGVTILPGPLAPVALPDSAAVPRCAGNITTFNVLTNDYDPNGDPMTVTLLGQGTYGTFTQISNGVITYVPTSFLAGYDMVTYQVCDNTGLCSTATIKAIVDLKDGNGCNPDQYYGIAQTISASIATATVGSPTGLANSLDLSDGSTADPTSYATFGTNGNTVVYSLSSVIPALGSLRLYVDASANGKNFTVEQSSDSTNWTNLTAFTVNSTDDFLDAYVKSYTVNAGTKWIRFKALSTSIYLDAMEYDVYSCVSAAPSLGNDAATTLEDVPVTIDVLNNDSDPLGKRFVISGISVWPKHGNVSINTDYTITYLNTKDQNALDSFTYRVVNSAGLISTAKVVIKIVADACGGNKYQAVSGTSTITTLTALNDNYLKYGSPTTNYGTTNDLRLKGKTADEKRPVFKFDLSTIPANAIIDSAVFSAYMSSAPASEIANIHRLTQAFGENTSTWNTHNGVTSWITAGGDYDGTVWSSRSTGTVSNVYLSWNLKSLVQNWVQGTYTNNGFILKRYPESSVGTFKDNSFKAKDNGSNMPKLYLRYMIPAACSTIPNRAALAMPDTANTNSITPVTINVSANDYNYSGNSITISRISLVSSMGGTITQSGSNLIYTPPVSPRFNGVDTFKYKITTNSLDDSAFVYVNVTNAPPSANIDYYTLPSNTATTPSSVNCDVRLNDTDPEGSSLTLPVITIQPTKGTATVDASGIITYTPDPNFYGKDSLVYQVGEAITGCNPFTDTAKVIFTVTNRAPVGVDDNVSTNACEIKQFKVLTNDTDPENGNMTVTITQAPGIGTATLVNNGTIIQYTPPVGVSNVTTTIKYQACDNASPAACSNITTLTITINPVPPTNNPPVAVRDTFNIVLNELLFANVLSNDSEPDGQLFSLPLTIVTNPLKGTVTPLPNGLIQYTPNINAYGIDSFLYRVYDSIPVVVGGTCTTIPKQGATAWVYIIIQNSPIAYPDLQYAHKNTPVNINVTANDIFGADGPATGTITIITQPKGGTASVLPGALSTQFDDQVRYVPNAGFASNDTLIYQICDTNGDCDTAIVIIKFYPDTDGDGVDDILDIDDDNDGITDFVETCGSGATSFSCLPGGTDPSLDNDNDGIVNYKDADFGTLNANGCVASLDSDGDGIPNYLDRDSDNDGIPDVVEAYGVDANGDGVIDNFTDTDGDGLSQNVDANNTGAPGSGGGLGFIDLDGDGIANSLDLDSDNDGIPDIVEALAPDTNNNGIVDGFTDTNNNGLNDSYEGASGLLLTGADTNNDGRADSYPNKNADQQGRPNPYDLDSDGDGITDALEAGFPGSVTVSNGVILGAATNGWANTVKAITSGTLTLANTDGRGPANYLDIDSDDDGISDNIEGQATLTYKVPTAADTDNDGLNDVYETFIGTFGGEGITPNDQESDGTPDYKDADTDNDGLLDLNEASKINTLTQANINITDTDGDGLVDQFDLFNIKTATAGTQYLNVSNNNMGTNGSFSGPTPSGSNVLLSQSLPPYIDRDWRVVTNLSLGNQVWYDFNGNGIKDAGESPVVGAIVSLYGDVNGDNIPDGGAVISTTTDATGTYLFTELSKTKFIVGVRLPTGYVAGNTTGSSFDPNNGTDNDNNGVTTVSGEVRSNYINLLANSTTLDFGLKGTGAIGDFVWYDVNANGVQNATEIGIAGVTVSLTNGSATITTTTNASGNYSFTDLAPGNYTLVVTTPAGYVASPALQGGDVTKDSDPSAGSVTFTLTPGQTNNNIDAGFYQVMNLGNTVWYDINANGIKDAGEAGISGATVKLYLDANNDNTPDGAATATTTTNASGIYAFSGLIPNNYIVGVTLPAGYVMVAANGGDPDNDIDNDNNGVILVGSEVRSNAVTLNSGSESSTDGDGANGNLTVDFALKGTGSIGDYVWNDINGNGIQEAGELPMEAITVTCTTPGGQVLTTTTDAAGNYVFQNLIAGTYTIAFTTPAGYFASPAGQGAAALNSDPVSGSVSVVLTSGQVRTDIDAGFYLPFTLGNQVWYDFNKNGLLDAGESIISGATVRLYLDANGDNNPDGGGGGTVVATTTTDVNGNYQFANLASGKYIVGIVLPSGYGLGTSIATTASPDNDVDNDNNGIRTVSSEVRTNYISINENNNSLDIGLIGNGSIGDFVWNDVNANGIQDASEVGLAGVTVTLTNAGGVFVTTITNASGIYSFTGVAPGTYTVSFATPAGYYTSPALRGSSSKDSDPVNGIASVTVTAGQTNTTIDAGFFIGFALGNKVWFDINNNGLLGAGEGGFAGIVVNLYTDTLSLNTPDGPAIATTTTDATGTYQFTRLIPGNYMVGVVLPTGYNPAATTLTSATPDNGTDNDNNGVNLVSGQLFTNNITVTADNNTLDLGVRGAGSIGNFVWNDLDNDGIQDAGEPGLAGVTVTLTIGTTTATAVTDASGNYSFNNLVPGTYSVAFTTPAGYVTSAPLQGGDVTKDSDPSGGSVNLTLGLGEVNTDVDAGFFVPSTIGDVVWYDFNANGTKDAGEAVISGATVKLYLDVNGDNIPDGAAIATTTTNASGIYSFTGLPINKYIVGVTMAGYQAGVTIATSANPDNGVNNDNNGINTAGSEIRSNYISLNGTNNSLDFGLLGTGSMGNFVWNDLNGNGIQEAGETGMQGVTVTLTNGAGVTITTTSNISGAYTFSNLAAGTYTVSFTTPSGYFASPANQGSDVTLNSDPVSGTVSVTLTAGQTKTDIDAGFYLPFSLGNLVWYDFNSNGLKDAGEPLISGATVRLYQDANGDNTADGSSIASTTTDVNGVYQFSNLVSGKYIVGVVLPNGYVLGIAVATTANPNNYVDNDNNGIRTVGSEVRTNYISVNGNLTTLDIGLIGSGTIGNFVFNDVNSNGTQDGNGSNAEDGIAGVTVTLTNNTGGTISTTTNSSGIYSFNNLIPGTYTVSFTTPPGYLASPSNVGSDDTKDSDPVGGSVSVTLSNGQTNTTVDAGFYIPYSLGNQVFYDFDNNGLVSSGETGISDAIVNLYTDNNGDNVPDGPAIATDITDPLGIYQFTDLPGGKYIVGVIADGYVKGATTGNSTNPNSGTDNDNNGVNVVGSEILSNFITLSGNNNTLDFGLKGTGSIGNYTWLDDNGNGVQDAGEAALAGVTVKLTNSGGITLTTTTDAFGFYNFPNIGPDTYTVFFKTPNGKFMTGAKQGTDPNKDSDPVEDVNGDGSVTVTVGPGEIADYIDAGFFIPFPLGNLVYYDINNNGIKDANETGISGLTVNLYDDKNFDNVPDGGVKKTTTTDAVGAYLFTDLRANGYIVGVVLPTGYVPSATTSTSADPNNNVNDDNNGVVLSGSVIRTNNINVASPRYDVDFGLKGTASVGNYVWYDANSNGIQNAGETGLAGVAITLTHSSGSSVSTTTNASGNYSFTGLIPGTYTVVFTTPQDYSATLANVGADDNIDSDPVNGTVSVTLTAGQTKNDVDAGYNQTFTVGNTVFYDFNNNGLLDAGETGISGATVKLYADANGDNVPDGAAVATTTTNASGIYEFSNLAGGNFIVGVTLPTGYVAGATTVTSANPNNYINNDNNGVTTVSGEVRTNYITLSGSSYTLDIGLRGTASIGDRVWIDADNDGIQDAAETSGIAGVTVSLTYTGGPTITTTTNASGIYTFSNLIPGTYTVTFTTPFGYLPSPALKGGNRAIDSDPAGGVVAITVTSGLVKTDVDAGFTASRSLGDVVWYDMNNNGLQDAGEPGLAGVTVKLYVDANTDNVPDGAATKVVTTDALGQYVFTALAVKPYIVGVVLPTGFQEGATIATSSTPNNLVEGDNNGINTIGSEVRSNYITLSTSTSTLDFGLFGTGSIGNFVFNDVNANGIQDAGEVGIPGATVTLTETGSGATATTTTDASGNYSFPNLGAYTYTVTFTTPSGYTPSPALQGGNTNLDSDPVSGDVSVTLTTGQNKTDIDAGFYQGFSLGNLVWDDYNDNGLKDASETGISGATVYLYNDANGDNVPDGAAIATTTTNGSGIYQFSNLPAGKFIVGVVTPVGYSMGVSTATSATPDNNVDNDNNGVTTVGSEVRSNYITINTPVSTLDIALKGTGSIGNFVWNDANGNGLQDAGEAGIAGVAVTVTNSLGNILSTTTNSSGFYSFSNLAPGTYTVTFTTPSGYTASPALQGSDRNLDSDPSGGTVSVTLTAGQSKNDADAGFFVTYTLGNRVWYDFNNNGLRDAAAGETGVSGATVKLYADANSDNIADGAAIATTTTNSTGLYQFSNVAPGKYIVGVALPSGYAKGATTATSSDPNNNTDDDNNGVNLVSTEVRTNSITLFANNTTVDFGLSGTGSIGDFVWNDVNGNGIQNGGAETGIAGATVSITNSGGMVLTTTTNASGIYSFSNLAPGSYTITFTTPSGYVASPGLQGGNGALDSDPVSGNPLVTITAGQTVTDVDAGFYQPFGLGNTVWYDVNGNGTKDAGEVGISGVTVNLYADANGDNIADGGALATTTTDVNGNYQFASLQSGKYIVGAVLPSGYATGITISTSSNPNNYIDNDNNGINLSGNEVRTNFITLNAATNTLDIGLRGGGTISDWVWLDANGNGIQDAGEMGIAGVTVTLTGNSSGINLSTTTDVNGNYSFNSLVADTYTIHFQTPSVAGAPRTILLIPRQAHAGSNTALDSDPDPSTGNATVVLAAGESKTDIDAGFSYDNDIDKDGIPNIVESNGYNPFADGDGDGIVNYLDHTQINGIPGKPLVWKDVNNDGINDFFDFDLDGVLNELDLDSDNDGILDIQETRDPRAVDANNNGMADGVDDDGDGILSTADQDDNLYGSTGLVPADLDGDGYANFIDLDSDNDGITDYTEATGNSSVKGMVVGTDSDGDGILAENFGSSAATVADNINGLGGKGVTLRDSDGDGKPDPYDIDSDNDGITDNAEAYATTASGIGTLTDTDGDGIADAYDTYNGLGTNWVDPYDFDGDGIPDQLDLDSDNDGIADNIEWQLGSSYVAANATDTDGDGLVDVYDTLPAAFGGGSSPQDSDGDNLADFRDRDSDNDGIPDVVEAYGVDANGDGIIDNFTDTDGDGLSQNVDANNTGIASSGLGLGLNDLDGDGVRNAVDLDSDNDGIPDIIEAGGTDVNNNGKVDSFSDANGNGFNDAYETTGALIKTGADANNNGRADSYPNKNTDGTGLPNPYDLDSDGDGLPDMVEAGFTGTGGIVAGTKGADGWSATIKALSALNLLNSDGTGPLNYLDLDSDNDGIGDNYEWQSGVYVAPTATDTDGDGIVDVYDASPNTFGGGKTAVDSDGDGKADYIDLDSDNDGIADVAEWQLMAGYVAPTSTDTDNDGLVDVYDSSPNAFGGIKAPIDSDGDGIMDYKDKDSDNDGIPDVVEAYGVDANGDGVIDNFTDTDNDGMSQNVDANNTGYAGSATGLGYADFDGDGIPNNLDPDSDNDGIPDVKEVSGADANNDGKVDAITDANVNGWDDNCEDSKALLTTGADTNGDGKADSYPTKNIDRLGKPNPYDLDSDGDGIADAVEAGFPGGVSVSNGMVTGAKTNGWANSVRALGSLTPKNTDGRGLPDFLDIDSDDDGITDNVEGQPTFSNKVPSEVDTDGDGVIDMYDISPGTYGAGGITPYDHDSDGVPDYMDLDTDNDGAPDINEASRYFNLTSGNINIADTDGDGLVDEFDNVDISNTADGAKFRNVSNSNMGTNGDFNGPFPSGSNVKLVRSLQTGDRDWRSASTLPLQIVSFSGNMQHMVAHLQWKVENEQQVETYMIERSFNGIQYKVIDKVKALNQNAATYNYDDNLTQEVFTIVYYRIRQKSKSGEEFVTNIIRLKPDDVITSNSMNLYPNPVVNELRLKLQLGAKSQADVAIYDERGRIVFQKNYTVDNGQNNIIVNETSKFAHGMYFVRVKIGDEIMNDKFIK